MRKESLLSKVYTPEEIAYFRVCYEDPNNEYSHLEFEDYIAEAEKQGVAEDLLQDVADELRNDYCIFECRRCEFARKDGNAFNCIAPSDEVMTCNCR